MENRPIGRWGRLHQDYLRDTEPGRYRCIFLSNGIWDYLDAIDEEASSRGEMKYLRPESCFLMLGMIYLLYFCLWHKTGFT